MPYIVTTKQDIAHPARLQYEVTSRRAVATLEEARRIVASYVPAEIDFDCWTSFSIPESGGTVGPLPDGRVVEVEHPESWSALAEPGNVFEHRHALLADQGNAVSQRILLDAYNARVSQ